ncbi:MULTISPECIES: hypothetical protein [unclassified Micromonospora]|uniref:hypothetical protein n=1 Tax=unclassified Micromonospora TaxID=2617518 RepID=UPI00331DDF1C
MGDDGERIEPWLLHHVRRIQRWQYGHTTHWASRHVTIGLLADGRWMVEHTDVTVGCRAYRDEQRARDVAAELTAVGEWVEVPAAYDAAGQPVGDGWVRRGGSWWRDTTSQETTDDR